MKPDDSSFASGTFGGVDWGRLEAQLRSLEAARQASGTQSNGAMGTVQSRTVGWAGSSVDVQSSSLSPRKFLSHTPGDFLRPEVGPVQSPAKESSI